MKNQADVVTPKFGTAPTGVDQPYDWDNYETDWRTSKAYQEQEDLLNALLPTACTNVPTSVLEVGPGFGRITRHLVRLFPPPLTKFALADISERAIEKVSVSLPQVDFTYAVGSLAAPQAYRSLLEPRLDQPIGGFELVVAIEVLMHIAPGQPVAQAVENLLALTKPVTGRLVTCDWTESLSPHVAIRNTNYRHTYRNLFSEAIGGKARVLQGLAVGLQTVYVVARDA